MKLTGLSMNDGWTSRVLAARPRTAGVEALEDLDARIGVHVEDAELDHHGPETRYRPYLHVTGELRSVRPVGGFGHDVDGVVFDPGRGERVDAYYEFDDTQLADLVSKGYFGPDLRIPSQILDVEWDLPAVADALVVVPDEADAVPVVLVRVHDLGDIALDTERSGYDLAAFFTAPQPAAGIEETEERRLEESETGVRSRDDAINPLFTEEEIAAAAEQDRTFPPITFDDEESDAPVASDKKDEGDDIDARLATIAADLDAVEADMEEREGDDGTGALYRDRVEVSETPVPALDEDVPEHVDLDLSDEDGDEDEESGKDDFGPEI